LVFVSRAGGWPGESSELVILVLSNRGRPQLETLLSRRRAEATRYLAFPDAQTVSLLEYSPSIVWIRNLCQRHEILLLRAVRFHGEPLAISTEPTGRIRSAVQLEHNSFCHFQKLRSGDKKRPAKSGKMRAIAGENGSRKGQILGKTGQATL
jgi:hypothetical protein